MKAAGLRNQGSGLSEPGALALHSEAWALNPEALREAWSLSPEP